jgi:lysine 6-dehydrogenase
VPGEFKKIVGDDPDRFDYFNDDSWISTINGFKKLKTKIGRVVVISCLPTEFNLDITNTCTRKGWSMVDLGGVTSVVEEQFKLDEKAKKVGSVIIPDCGLAPGIISSLAYSYKLNEGDRNLHTIRAYCGGIPLIPEPPLGYVKTFHPAGVIKEYSGVAQEIKDGSVISVPTLSGREFVFVPSLGVLEAAVTSGGVSITPHHLPVKNFSYKTLRYPGHWNYIEKYIMSQQDPVKALEPLLEEVSEDNQDIITLMFELVYDEGCSCEAFYWEYDEEAEISAMAQATGYVVGAVAKMISDGKVVRNGVLGMHELPAQEIIDQVRLMGPDQFSTHPIRF